MHFGYWHHVFWVLTPCSLGTDTMQFGYWHHVVWVLTPCSLGTDTMQFGYWHHVGLLMVTNVSVERAASIFRIEVCNLAVFHSTNFAQCYAKSYPTYLWCNLLNAKISHIKGLCQDLVRISQRTRCVSVRKTNRPVLYWNALVSFCNSNTETKNALCRQN